MTYRTATRTRTALLALARREGWTVYEDLWGNAATAKSNPGYYTDSLARGRESVFVRFLGEKLTRFSAYDGSGVVINPTRSKAETLVSVLIDDREIGS